MKTIISAATLIILSVMSFTILKSAFFPTVEVSTGTYQTNIVQEVMNTYPTDDPGMKTNVGGGGELNQETISTTDQSWMLRSAVEFRFIDSSSNETKHAALGTKLDEQTVLTHNHQANVAMFNMVDPVNTAAFYEIAVKRASLPLGHGDQYGDQTRMVYLPEKVTGSYAPIASQQIINQLAVGEFVEVVYWDDAVQRLGIARFQIKGFLGKSVMVLDDPDDIINEGDSGGGVFFQDTLIGNTWKFIQVQDLQGNQVEKEIYVQIIPPDLDQALRNWQVTRENMKDDLQSSNQDRESCLPEDANASFSDC